MLITIVTLVYNGGAHIRQTLESLQYWEGGAWFECSPMYISDWCGLCNKKCDGLVLGR